MNEWVIVGIVAIAVIFGATKLPEIARNLGRSSNEFKKGLKEGAEGEPAKPATPDPITPDPITPDPIKPADPPSTEA